MPIFQSRSQKIDAWEFSMIRIYRLSRWLYLHGVPVLPTLLKGINRILFSVVLPPSARVGRDVIFGYQGLGIVVHMQAVIGERVIISPNVVIGGRGLAKSGAPVIESDVLIGAGACVLGAVGARSGRIQWC